MHKINEMINLKKSQLQIDNSVLHDSPKPLIFSPLAQASFEKEFSRFLEQTPIVTIRDSYEDQLAELYELRHPESVISPEKHKQQLADFLKSNQNDQQSYTHSGSWVYYPWTGNLVHFLEPDLHDELRTARNRWIVSDEEQRKFRNCVVGIGGLSIGNSVALSLVYSGGCQTMKLADPDVFSGSNLNRVRVPVAYIGLKKAYVAAHQIYELNPYAHLIVYPDGITPNNIEEFFLKEPKIDIIADELDNFPLKLILRLAAKSAQIPLMMATDNSDNVILDVFRFDINNPNDPNTTQFPRLSFDQIVNKMRSIAPPPISLEDRIRLASSFVGPEYIEGRMQESLLEVGKSLASWPQLATAAFINGAAMAYLIKKLAIGEVVNPGRSILSIDEACLPNYNAHENQANRHQKTAEFIDKLDLNNSNHISLPDILAMFR